MFPIKDLKMESREQLEPNDRVIAWREVIKAEINDALDHNEKERFQRLSSKLKNVRYEVLYGELR